MIPAWLNAVLAEHAAVNLTHPDGRTVMAEAIGSALPSAVIVAAIRESVAAVFASHQVDITDQLLRELANNATQSVLLMLQVDE